MICLEEVLHLDTLVPLATLRRLDLTNCYTFTKTRLADQKVVPKRVFAFTFLHLQISLIPASTVTRKRFVSSLYLGFLYLCISERLELEPELSSKLFDSCHEPVEFLCSLSELSAIIESIKSIIYMYCIDIGISTHEGRNTDKHKCICYF